MGLLDIAAARHGTTVTRQEGLLALSQKKKYQRAHLKRR